MHDLNQEVRTQQSFVRSLAMYVVHLFSKAISVKKFTEQVKSSPCDVHCLLSNWVQ